MTQGKRWFRMYAEVVHDPKIQMLPAPLLKFWLNALCLCGDNDGQLPDDTAVAFALRMAPARAKANLAALQASGLFDERKPHNWDARQYKNDVSTDRVKRFREQKRNADDGQLKREMKRHETVSETPSETEADTETEQNRAEAVRVSPVAENPQQLENLPMAADDQFQKFRELYQNAKPDSMAADFELAWNPWRLLDYDQRAGVVRSLEERARFAERVWCAPTHYLRTEWRRPVLERKPALNGKPGLSEASLELMRQVEAEREQRARSAK